MYRVLYVDDEPGILELVRMYLESYGTMLVDICPSAEDAEELIKETNYDTIVLDYYMPDVNGIEFLKNVRKKGFDCPIIIYTGRGREDVVIDALNNGADFYLQKAGEPTREFTDLYVKVQQAISKYHAEKRVKETSALLRSTLESTADGILVVDTEGKITAWNRKFVQMWGIPYHLIEGGDYTQVLSYMLPQIREQGNYLQKSIDSNGKRIRPGLDVVTLRDGRTYERYSQPQMIDGELVGKVWSFRDITAKNSAEEALRESEERFRSLFEQAPIPYFSLDNQGNIVDINEAWTRVTGYDRAEVTGHPFLKFIPAGMYADYPQFLSGVMSTGSFCETEMSILLREGSVIPVILTGRILSERPGLTAQSLWTITDLSEQRLIEAQNTEALNQIQRNLAELAILNDGIRNPLTVIAGLAEIKLGEVAQDIMAQVQEIDRMIDQLDQRWHESTKILHYLRRHHGILFSDPESPDVNEKNT